ncbi:MAG TPA: hypothetical protein VFY43_07105 [Candidatus Limnocylindria bacterium]|nr:hypothetical protein [Candidatus Limnocylindria bacterium]
MRPPHARRPAAPRPLAWTALAALGALLIGAPPPVAAADGGLVVIAQARYRVLPAEHRIHVTIDAVATSLEPDTPEGRVYYSGISFAVQAGASNLAATSGGQPIGIRIEAVDDDFTAVQVTFGRGVFYRQSYAYTVSFDLVDPGGAGTRDLRIGSSLAAFPVWAFGTKDEPGGSVQVELPPGYATSIQGWDMTKRALPDGGVLLSAEPDDPLAFFAYVSADRPGAFADRQLTLDVNGTRAELLVRAWDDDPAWDRQVTRLLRRGLPALQALIGVDYPVRGRLSVEEAATSRLGEYAGIYNRVTGVIRVRYDADAFVTLHEAAHLWFNADLFEDRWIGEAWAEFYGVAAGRRIGARGSSFELTDDLRDARIPLNDWGAIGVESLATEDFAYAATYELAQRIASRTDLAALRDVWRAAESAEMAYQPIHGSAVATRGVPFGLQGWQQLLDLLEQRTGEAYTDLWQDWVVNADQQPQLAARQAARHAYAETVAVAGEWELPESIRAEMGAWQFDGAREALDEAGDVLADRDRIEDAAAALQLTPPATLRATFEGTDGLAAAAAEADAERDALAVLAAASEQLDGEPGMVEVIGLLGADPGSELATALDAFEAGDLDQATAAAVRATDARAGADDAGRLRVLAAGGAVLLLDALGLGLLFSRRGRRHHAQEAPPASPVA